MYHIMFQNETDDSYFETVVSNALFRTFTSNLFKALKFHFSFEVSSPFQLFGYPAYNFGTKTRRQSKRAVRLEQRTFGIVLVSLLLTLKRFHAMLRCFHLKKKIPFRRSTNETLKSSHYYKVSFVALMNMGEGNQLSLHYSS